MQGCEGYRLNGMTCSNGTNHGSSIDRKETDEVLDRESLKSLAGHTAGLTCLPQSQS